MTKFRITITHKILTPRNHRFCNAGTGYRSCLKLFRSFTQEIASFLIYFIRKRVGVVPPPSSRRSSSIKLIRLGPGAVGATVQGLTSSPACLRTKGHCCLLSLSKHLPSQSRTETWGSLGLSAQDIDCIPTTHQSNFTTAHFLHPHLPLPFALIQYINSFIIFRSCFNSA